MVRDKNGRTHVPNEGAAVVGGIIAVGFGILWTAMAFGITSVMPPEGPFGVARIIFPAFGILFIFAGAFAAATTKQKAGRYKAALRRYEDERRQLERASSSEND